MTAQAEYLGFRFWKCFRKKNKLQVQILLHDSRVSCLVDKETGLFISTPSFSNPISDRNMLKQFQKLCP
jgi:hypothetical protein